MDPATEAAVERALAAVVEGRTVVVIAHRLSTAERADRVVVMDDGRVVEELLPAGASREWATQRRFVVTIGNAGGVEVTLNGKALPALGAKGTVIQRLELPPPPAASGS